MLSAILLGLVVLSFIILVFLLFNTGSIYGEVVSSLNENSQKVNQRDRKLKNLENKLKENPKELKGSELERLMQEISNIPKLWKSRKERLKMGLWEKIGEEEEVKKPIEKEEDELSKLKKRKEQINNLMQKAKIEYRKRKIDEVSFREIMRDYQKELMEIDVKLSELE